MTYFNSIKVRLKPSCLAETLMFDLFQFHKGTIKTTATERRKFPTRRFQFHKGTIKTYCKMKKKVTELYFNSINVRLKQFNKREAISCFIFQFHKGTIKTMNRVLAHNYLTLFQFHKGTIKTSLTISRVGFSWENFNSIKVRLKQGCYYSKRSY